MHSLNYPVRVAGVAMALGLFASACGGESPATIEAAPAAQAETGEASETPEPVEPTEPNEPVGPAESESDTGSDGDQDDAAPAAHLFPDLDTVNIVDGSTVNLAAELAGGDTPVLLWFWAPH